MTETRHGPAPFGIVTGAASGIGAATASKLITEGWNILGLDKNREGLDTVQSELGPQFVGRALDLAVSDQVSQFVTSCRGRTIDGIAACAGLQCTDQPPGINQLVTDKLMAVNFWPTATLVRELSPNLKAAPHPRIVIVTSVHSRRAEPGYAEYAVTKSALESLVRSSALELGAAGILVNGVAPGFVDTPMAALPSGIREHETEAFKATYIDSGRLPLRRTSQPAEIAEVIAFLLSMHNSYMTGQTILVDGGLTLSL